jgi:putative transposase
MAATPGPRPHRKGGHVLGGASYWATLCAKNVLDRHPWATRQELRIAIVTWIERTYHRRRRQESLGRLTPIGYEAIMTTAAAQAA